MRYRVWNRPNSLEPEDSILIALENGAAIRSVPVRMLHIVEAFRVSLPDIDLYVGHRSTRGVLNCTQHQKGSSVRIRRDGASNWGILGFVCVERSKNGAFCRVWRFWMVDRVHKQGKSKNVGEKNKLLEAKQLVLSFQRLFFKLTCLTSELILPTETRNCSAVIHSSVLRQVSRAKS
jgi:hypothetical protein